MFVIRSQSATRGHLWKLLPRHYRTTARKHFFCERVIALSVNNNESLGSVTSFKLLLKDPIYHHLYITHRPSTGIIMLCYCTNY